MKSIETLLADLGYIQKYAAELSAEIKSKKHIQLGFAWRLTELSNEVYKDIEQRAKQ